MRALLVALVVVLTGCRDPGPSGPARDAGHDRTPVDAAVLDDLVMRYAALRTDYAGEACRCAGDVPYCEAKEAPPLDAAGQTCLRTRFESDPARFDALFVCLRTAVDAYVGCAMPWTCPEVDPRTQCRDTYTDEGTACLDTAGAGAEAALATCALASGSADGG